MNWRNVFLIFHREVLDQLRDRRTLFMITVVPVLLYPLLGIGTTQMTTLFTEQPRTVVILGADNLPPQALLSDDRFDARWFASPADADKLHVLSDRSVSDDASESGQSSVDAGRLTAARHLRDLLVERRELVERHSAALQQADQPEISRLNARLVELNHQLTTQFERSNLQVLVVIPSDFAQALARRQEQLATRMAVDPVPADQRPLLVLNSADEKSAIAFRRVLDVFHAWERAIQHDLLQSSQLPESLINPVNMTEVDLAEQHQVSANIWSKVFPAILVMMTLTGAFYPAVDLCAGEKERGTMETLLICPATRREIVLGKFLTVMLFSITMALLNLFSIGLTGKYMASLALAGSASRLSQLATPPLMSLGWVIVVLIPLASLFSALCLALATFARSSKEGQYYLTPLLIVTLGLTVFCISPGTEMQPFLSVMPVVGPSLLLKGLMKANGPDTETYLYAIPVLLTSAGYSLMALWWAVQQFECEEILFGEAEQFNLGLWFRQLVRNKRSLPTFGQASFCLIVLLLLQFLSWKPIQSALLATPESGQTRFQLQVLMLQQIFLIAAPALIMGGLLTSSLRQTFAFRWPGIRPLGQAALLALALHPVTLEMMAHLQWFFPPPPPGVVQMMQHMQTLPLGLTILAFAVLPALCEEIAFRGYLLSGFGSSGKRVLAVILSSFAFGLIHMIPQQVFNATLLGLVLGTICVLTKSLLPGMVFHFVYNSLGVLHSRWGSNVPADNLWGFFFRLDEHVLRYQMGLLVVLIPLAVYLLNSLRRQSRIAPSELTPLSRINHG